MKKRRFRITVSYEPNRLAENYLSDAYEKLIPTIKQKINVVEKGNNVERIKMIENKLKGNFK